MRRSEQEIKSRAEIDAVIRSCQVCRLGLCDDGQPYIVPMSFGYDGESLYFHCANEGRKLDILRRNPRVCVELDVVTRMLEADNACGWDMAYRSVMGTGTVEFLDDPKDKLVGLKCLIAQYSDRDLPFSEKGVERVCVFRVRLESVTGKQSG
jgi:nitroimidazol reductase NimA-like FMN-containing flavoprotein (pyridoxamine 5'-phosphate oxidase superfamily)